MMQSNNKRRVISGPVCLLGLMVALGGPVAQVHADEGMWLLTNPATEAIKAKYNFEPTDTWLGHIQRAAVRIGRGGSGSLVSPNGLIMTNHHVGVGQLEKLSTLEDNLLEKGFIARTRDQERPCPDLEVNILWTVDDVTASVAGAAPSSASPAEANAARLKQMAELTSKAEADSGLDCEVVTLYHGARDHMYCYKRYTDVRLVMAPEGDIAHFGGDVDNFEYPRYCLDMCFFRIYENRPRADPFHCIKDCRTDIGGNQDIASLKKAQYIFRTGELIIGNHAQQGNL